MELTMTREVYELALLLEGGKELIRSSLAANERHEFAVILRGVAKQLENNPNDEYHRLDVWDTSIRSLREFDVFMSMEDESHRFIPDEEEPEALPVIHEIIPRFIVVADYLEKDDSSLEAPADNSETSSGDVKNSEAVLRAVQGDGNVGKP
jgi:hypothetical protein